MLSGLVEWHCLVLGLSNMFCFVLSCCPVMFSVLSCHVLKCGMVSCFLPSCCSVLCSVLLCWGRLEWCCLVPGLYHVLFRVFVELYFSVMACSVVWSVVLVKGCPVIFCSVFFCSVSLGLSHHVLLCSRSSWSDTVVICSAVLCCWPGVLVRGFPVIFCLVLFCILWVCIKFFSFQGLHGVILFCPVLLCWFALWSVVVRGCHMVLFCSASEFVSNLFCSGSSWSDIVLPCPVVLLEWCRGELCVRLCVLSPCVAGLGLVGLWLLWWVVAGLFCADPLVHRALLS